MGERGLRRAIRPLLLALLVTSRLQLRNGFFLCPKTLDRHLAISENKTAVYRDKSGGDGFDIEGILDLLFGVIVDIARFFPYDDAAYDGLVQCLLRVLEHDGLHDAGNEVGYQSL
jgi:hypothetical protein